MAESLDKSTGRGKPAEVSVILRRQVPIRFDEPARSWLGGLPQMPDNIRWPRTANSGGPLHFIAHARPRQRNNATSPISRFLQALEAKRHLPPRSSGRPQPM